MTNETPDHTAFSKVEFPGVYLVEIEVRGSITVEITADSADAAREKAGDFIDEWEEDGYPELDEVCDTSVEKARQKPSRYRISRGGKPYQVSFLTPGDLPREPDERGF